MIAQFSGGSISAIAGTGGNACLLALCSALISRSMPASSRVTRQPSNFSPASK
jgi:hypothetical protein